MATKKQSQPAAGGRPYTGNSDPADGARPGTVRFQQYMTFLFQMKNLGIYANRPVRGGSGLSVHATGRAADLGGGAGQIVAAIAFLERHADELGIEEIHDYGNRYRSTTNPPSAPQEPPGFITKSVPTWPTIPTASTPPSNPYSRRNENS